MRPTHPSPGARAVPDARADDEGVDWVAAERSPEFRDLIKQRRAFVLPATIFFLTWYLGFILLAGYAPDFMGESIYEGFTVGYALALTQFVMVWVLSWLYLRRSDRVFDGLAARAGARALEVRGPAGSGVKPAAAADAPPAPPAGAEPPATAGPDQPPTERRAT